MMKKKRCSRCGKRVSQGYWHRCKPSVKHQRRKPRSKPFRARRNGSPPFMRQQRLQQRREFYAWLRSEGVAESTIRRLQRKNQRGDLALPEPR